MIYFVTGITGTVVPVVIEELMKKDSDPFFYFAIRNGKNGEDISTRFDALVDSMDMEPASKQRLSVCSKLVKIDIKKEKIGIDPETYTELIENVEKVLHGAADVRFDQPYEKIRFPNLVFTQKVYDLFSDIKQFRKASNKPEPLMYYIGTSYAYGAYKGAAPEDYPDFAPAEPDNTYAQTKAEAKHFILDKIKRFNDKVVIFEPTIIGGSSKDGRTRKYNLHYMVMMLGYLGKLPVLTAPDNQLDIVPVDWVAGVISDIMAKNEFRQGVLRLASGDKAITIRQMHDIGYAYYTAHDPDPDHVIPPIRFLPKWAFHALIYSQQAWFALLYGITRKKKLKKVLKGIAMLKGYIPYMTGYKLFDNSKSAALISKYTDCPPVPLLQDTVDEDGNIIKGYFDIILADTLRTGWGGMVRFKKQQVQEEAAYRKPRPARAAFGRS